MDYINQWIEEAIKQAETNVFSKHVCRMIEETAKQVPKGGIIKIFEDEEKFVLSNTEFVNASEFADPLVEIPSNCVGQYLGRWIQVIKRY